MYGGVPVYVRGKDLRGDRVRCPGQRLSIILLCLARDLIQAEYSVAIVV